MNKDKAYIGIDYFRLLAAFLVIAIHTSPLSSYSELGDFILTRILARVAVPFFFMVSGFFLITRYQYNDDKLKGFLKKTAGIYIISIAIYIPLNIYNGYFTMNHLLPNIIKDIIFDGTIYHLWYLPASMLGAAVTWFGVKRWGYKKTFIITLVLYMLGLLGDSYYGLIEKIPLLKNMYDAIFEIFDYTRNGIFFAPIFFCLGGRMADKSDYFSKNSTVRKSILGFFLSLLLLFVEGILLHQLGLQRHDSMYIFLLPSMYFLFSSLLFWKGRLSLYVGRPTLIIYMIHPMVIVAVRMFAKLFRLERLLIQNSLIHFVVVSIISAVFSILAILFFYKVRGKRENTKKRNIMKRTTSAFHKDRAWIEIDINNLEHNVKILKEAMPKDCELMAVVKAEAYGHGAFQVSTYLSQMGVRAFAVATIEEGIALRRYGVFGEILIFGYTNPERAKELHKYNLTQSLIDFNYANALCKQKVSIKTHIKIDTGMHRLGFDMGEIENIIKIFQTKYLKVEGIYTHLCASDSLADEDICFTKKQISNFYKLLEELTKSGIKLPKTHIQSSYGLLNYPELSCNYVRAGISLYGVLSSSNDKTKLQLDLRPVLSLKSNIVLIRKVNKGERVGYSRAFVAERDTTIAILPIGYADGFPRTLSEQRGSVLIGGHFAPVIGRVCMDQLAVDITEIPNIAVGDIATLIGEEENKKISASEAAYCAGTISNELLSRMGKRLSL